jgi:hypothetical protein
MAPFGATMLTQIGGRLSASSGRSGSRSANVGAPYSRS